MEKREKSINRSESAHDSAHTHVSGRSEFIGDRPMMAGELLVDVFYSPSAHARIRRLDIERARALPGVAGVFTAKDLHHNLWGPIIADQPLLVEEVCKYVGEPIAVIAATSVAALKSAKRAILLELEELPAHFSIEEAIAKKTFLGKPARVATGDVKKVFANKKLNRLKGSFYSGGQEHFYFEPQSTVVYPCDQLGAGLEVHSSSQHPTEIQHVVAHAVGLSQQQVVCIVKRMGGGFGGKESQASHFAALAALVAVKLNRPARIVLERDDDMRMTGKRHPFLTNYEVAFDDEGKILALKAELFADGGAYIDLSPAILQRALFHIDNAYYIPHAELNGKICFTNLASNTAFRGFGGPQGMAVIEDIIEEIALVLDKEPLEIRKINCYQIKKCNKTPYGQVVANNMLPELFAKIEKSSDYLKRKKEIAKFNLKSKTHVRGLAITPVKFGISFTATLLNQGSALVNLYTDGTLQVSTGATEMGQGVYAKIKKVVADTFSLQMECVRVMPTSTEKNPNTSATAASSGADLNCSAALMAAVAIRRRLASMALHHFTAGKSPLRYGETPDQELELKLSKLDSEVEFKQGVVYWNKKKGAKRQSITFKELVSMAYVNRMNLSAQAYYRTPHIYYDLEKGQGHPFLYYTQGVAASEVEIDRFTGHVRTLRSDIIMDLGRPINRELDIGQISGAFIQGLGWVTTEELYYSAKGVLLSNSPTTYKIPNIQDVPALFTIELIENSGNTLNVYGSKAVGEPPFPLCLSVFAAIRNAITRGSNTRKLALSIPARAEDILKSLN
ncbi:MAG: xanthine dehydrogenase molybdopterin binding subunit [Oligoflexia bacterium]|nr:xanthine dehydrogenase molybdopterin binding subunit [Oligoflexia bacterium]